MKRHITQYDHAIVAYRQTPSGMLDTLAASKKLKK